MLSEILLGLLVVVVVVVVVNVVVLLDKKILGAVS